MIYTKFAHRLSRAIVCILFSAFLVVGSLQAEAFAAEGTDEVTSPGTTLVADEMPLTTSSVDDGFNVWHSYGECEWQIESPGEGLYYLVIRPAGGKGFGWLPDWGTGKPPWSKYSDIVIQALVQKGVKARSCRGMFKDFTELAYVDVTDLDTSSVNDMAFMFSGCSQLSEIDQSLNTESATSMDSMFEGTKVQELDLSSFLTKNVRSATYMFHGCRLLVSIYVGSSWSLSGVTRSDGMFKGCERLVGSRGTKYSFDHIDAEYARVEADGAPGYLTDKTTGKQIDINSFLVKLEFNSHEETGDPIEPRVTVTSGKQSLSLGTDFDVAYTDNVKPGIAKVTVTGIGRYFGNAEAQFEIKARKVYAIASQPADCIAAAGQKATFKVDAPGASAYQWLWSRDGGSKWAECSGAGCDGPEYSFKMLEARSGRLYRCEVTFEDGSKILSDTASLTLREPYAIASQPSDCEAEDGGTASFSVSAPGAASYRWLWSKNGGASWAECSMDGAAGETYSFKMARGRAGRLYRCEVTFEDGSKVLSKTAKLTLKS